MATAPTCCSDMELAPEAFPERMGVLEMAVMKEGILWASASCGRHAPGPTTTAQIQLAILGYLLLKTTSADLRFAQLQSNTCSWPYNISMDYICRLLALQLDHSKDNPPLFGLRR